MVRQKRRGRKVTKAAIIEPIQICTLDYDAQSLTYFLQRKAIKTLSLRVKRDGEVYISAPVHLSKKDIETFIKGHWQRVWEMKRWQQAKLEREESCTYDEQSILWFWGEPLRLQVVFVESRRQEGVRWDNECLCLYICRGNNTISYRRKLWERYKLEWGKLLLEDALKRTYERFKAYKIPYPTLYLRRMKTRWGSCTPARRKITLSTRLLDFPPAMAEYVLVHELIHFMVPNHSAAFYRIMYEVEPRWQSLREELRTWERKALS